MGNTDSKMDHGPTAVTVSANSRLNCLPSSSEMMSIPSKSMSLMTLSSELLKPSTSTIIAIPAIMPIAIFAFKSILIKY